MNWTRREQQADSMRSAMVRVIESLGVGEVVSYGDVAERSGYPNRHRAVGRLLASAMDALPWWRVVYASGHLPPCHPTLQESRLIDEGVELSGFRVIRSPAGRFLKTDGGVDREVRT